MPERVVFDTNVVVAGLLWRGKAHQCGDHHLLDLVRYQDIPIISPAEFVASAARSSRE
jgi:predicted nucleic acid-binding protein